MAGGQEKKKEISNYQAIKMELEGIWVGKVKVGVIVIAGLGAISKTLKGFLKQLAITKGI